jgi:hypothetical protein
VGIIRISETKSSPKRRKEKLGTQISGKCNDISSGDENKQISLYSLYLNVIKRQHIYSSIDDSEAVLVFERNNAGLKKLPSSVWTKNSSAFLNALCLFKVRIRL